MWKQTGRQYREAVNSCHTLVLRWQRGAEWGKEWNCKWRARQTVEQVLRWSTSRPEENVGLLTDRVSPGKLRNWSGTHSSPAATLKGTQSVKSKRLTIVYLLKTGCEPPTSSELQSFSWHKVLRSCRSTSGSGGLDLALLWLRRAVLAGGLWTLLIANSEQH